MGNVLSFDDEDFGPVVDLSAASLEDDALARAIGGLQHVKMLDLSYAKVGPKSARVMVSAMERNKKSLTKLNLEQNGGIYAFGKHKKEYARFCEALKDQKSMRYLNVVGSAINEDPVKLADALRGNETLRLLDLGKNMLTMNPESEKLLESLCTTNINSLLLSDNGFSEKKEWEAIAKIVRVRKRKRISQ